MKNQLIGKYIEDYFSNYLCYERGVSENTMRSYAYTIKELLKYIKSQKKILADKVTTEMVDRKAVADYLRWLIETKKLSVATCNQRLAIISSFARYMAMEDVTHSNQWHQISEIKKKKAKSVPPNYLSEEGVQKLLEAIPTTTIKGRRDLALLLLMYESGARVQEIIDLTPQNIRISVPGSVRLHGKGNKTRIVPLSETPCEIIQVYMHEHKLDKPENNCNPLFYNNRGNHLSESGINYIINEYADIVRADNPGLLPDRISPHSLRHTRAMHLINNGLNLIYLRDILGHVSTQTTEIYARVNSKTRNEALENAYTNVAPEVPKTTVQDDDKLIAFLDKFSRK